MPSRTEAKALSKQMLRHQACSRREEAHAARGDTAGAALTCLFRAAFSGRLQGVTVALYWPMRDEIDVRSLIGALAADGVRTVLPVMEGPHEALVFREWRPGDVLVPGMFGVEEPAADAPALTPDIVVTPLLAFDAAGNRLGYGGGFYDRTLRGLRARYNTLAIGGAYDEQEFPTLPVHTGDEVLDMIITDRRILSVGM